VLREIAGHNLKGAAIGHLAFGEYIYAAGSASLAGSYACQPGIAGRKLLLRKPQRSCFGS